MAQFGYPTSDITVGSWTNVGGPTSHWDCLNEVSYSDSDYIQANNVTANVCEVQVNTLTDPVSSVNHIVHLRVQKAGSGTITLNVALVENTTVRATRSITLTTSWVDRSFTLTDAEADAITDYTNLRIRFTATCASSSRYVRVSWANVEVPDVAQNIEETVDLDKFIGVSFVMVLVVEDSVSLSRSAGQGGSELGNLQDIVTQDRIDTIDAVSQTNEKDGLTLGRIINITLLDQTNEKDQVTLGRISDIILDTQTNEKDNISLGRISSITSSTQTDEKDAISLAYSTLLNVDEHQSVMTEDITFSRIIEIIISEETQGQANEDVTLTRFIGISITEEVKGQTYEDVVLNRLNGVGINTQLISSETVILSEFYGVVINDAKYLYENITLEYNNGLLSNYDLSIFEGIILGKVVSISPLILLIAFSSISLERLGSVIAEPPSLYVFTNGDHAIAVLFRDKRIEVPFRDKRASVYWRDKRIDK